MYRSKSVLLSAFMVITLVASVNVMRLIPELIGPPRNITSWHRIIAHGYPAELHAVETYDGYTLNIVRIPYSSKESDSQPIRRPAVLLMHGTLSSSDIFLLAGPNSGLPFLLADASYDVWLANARGNTYSKQHRKFATYNRRFWHFGWHEIGEIDMAAIIDYILELTREKKIHFVGHSQGSTVYLVLMSMRPEYNKKIKTSHFLAPIAFQTQSRDVMFKKLARIIGNPGKWSNLVMDREIFIGNAYLQRVLDKACGADVRLPRLCRKLVFFYVGKEKGNLNMTLVPSLYETHPAGASTNQLIHYSQLYLGHDFRQFDYGFKKNMKRYGQRSPPSYELKKVTSPIYIYYSDYDVMATTEDVQRLALQLPNLKLNHRVPFPNWTHVDFVLGFEIKRLINDPIIQTCIEYDQLESQ